MERQANGKIGKTVGIIWARSVLEARLLRVARTLGDEGYDVKVFAWDRECEKEDVERHENFDCHYLHLKAPYDSPMVFLLLPLWWLCALRFVLKLKPDVLHACDFDSYLPARTYAKLRSIPLIYDIFDVYGMMVARSVPPFLARLLVIMERAAAEAADGVIMVNEFQYIFLGRPELRASRYLVNSPYETDMTEVEAKAEEMRRSLGEEERDKITVFYAGSLEYARRFDQILDAIEGLDEIVHIVAGSGADADRLVPMFEKSENTRYIGPIPFAEVLVRSTLADILYVLCDSSTEKCRMGAQTRLFIGMMCGTPLIVTANTNAADMVEGGKCGLSVEDGNIGELRSTIRRLAADSELRGKLGENGRETYYNEYSWDKLKGCLVNLYSDLFVE